MRATRSKKNLFGEEEQVRKYDFYQDDLNYLIREDQKFPDIFLYPEFRENTMRQLGKLGLLTGKALEEYEGKK